MTVAKMVSPQTRNRLNFSGGPGALPEVVLAQVQESIIAVPEVGLSILGISHRCDWFADVVAEAESNVRDLLGLPQNYHVLFLQGGATQQFSMVPMTFLAGQSQPAEYLHTGYWSGKAFPEARREGPVTVLWSGESDGFRRLPADDELVFSPDAPYIHYVSNETVEGLQFHRTLGHDSVPRVCDMSSDFLSASGDFEQFSLIYAHAQKNLGPAGVTIVVVKDEFLGDNRPDQPGFLDYRTQIEAHSIYNTPPVFAIYVVLLVTRWLRNDIGGLGLMGKINREKAATLYQALDADPESPRAAAADRSVMNVAFNLATPELEQRFLAESEQLGFSGLEGHRSIKGLRASLYNGLELSAVEDLVAFMDSFRRRHG